MVAAKSARAFGDGGRGRRARPRAQVLKRHRLRRAAVLAGSHDRHHDRTAARADIAFEVDDLLPSAEHGFSVGDGDGKRRSQERGLEV